MVAWQARQLPCQLQISITKQNNAALHLVRFPVIWLVFSILWLKWNLPSRTNFPKEISCGFNTHSYRFHLGESMTWHIIIFSTNSLMETWCPALLETMALKSGSSSQRVTLRSAASCSLVKHEQCFFSIKLSLEKPVSHRYVEADIVVSERASFFCEWYLLLNRPSLSIVQSRMHWKYV